MRKQFIIILLALLAIFGLMVSCKNEVSNAGFGEELVSVSFKEDTARGLTATLEGFDKDHLYWAYAAEKADGSNLISGETDSYDESDAVWVKTDGYNKPVEGLGTTGTSGYEAYKVSGFSQGYWNFKLYAYKGVLGDNPATIEVETDYVTGYVLVYQGETLNVLLKSDSVNTQGSHLVSVIVDPIQSQDNGTMVFLTNKTHSATARISMNTVNSATYGEHYTVKVLSVQSMEEIPTEYVGTAAEKKAATDSQDGLYSLPAGSYKVTVAFTDSASAPTVNYARGTIVATVYSNLTTTISGDLTEAMTYAEFDGTLNPDLETVTASNDQPILITDPETTVVLTTKSSAAKEVTASIKAWDTNRIINSMADAAGTNTDDYDQNLNLTLSVETVETTATTATYEIGMSAKLTSLAKGTTTVVSETTSDVSEVEQYVTVEVQLETGLTSVNVLHDGKQMIPGLDSEDKDKVGKFAYNGTTGILTIKTMSFSPFEVSFVKPAETSYVAQVGKVKYQSLAAAISAAKTDGTDTITLLNDVSLTSETDISKKVVLDLAGYRITAAAGLKASVAETTVKNGNIDAALTISGTGVKLSAVAVKGSIAVSGSAAFDSDCSVTGTGDCAIDVTGSITIDGGTYTAAEGECILSGKAAISDGNFNGSLAPEKATGIVLKGGTYTEMQAAERLAPGFECAEISDGVYMVRNIVEAVNVRTGVKYHYLQNAIDAASAGDTIKLLRSIVDAETYVVEADKNITIDLNGKSIETKLESADRHFYALENYGTLTLKDSLTGGSIIARGIKNTGGKMTIDSGVYYDIDTNGGAAVWNENKKDRIDGWFVDLTKYDAYSSDSHISEVDADISELGITKEAFDYDFYNYESSGYGWKMDDNSYLLIYNKYSKEEVVAELTVNGGSFIVEHVGSASDSSGPGGIYSGSGTKLTINAATISSKNLRTYALRANGVTEINGDENTVVVNGAHGALAVDTGSIIVNGGSFSATEYYGCWITNNGSDTRAVINGGSFTGTYGLYSSVDDGGQDVSDIAILVNGGTFIGTTGSAVINEKGTDHEFALVLKGGAYSSDPSAYVAEGYEAVYDGDIAMWTVSKILAVQIMPSGEYYGTFKAAYDDAVSGDTLYILRDLAADGLYDFSGKNITIHVNEGKTLSCGNVTNGKFDIGWNNAAGTLTLEGPGKITFTSNSTWGLITQNGSGDNIKAVVKNITIEASSANGRVASDTGVNLTVVSGYFKNIVFDSTGKGVSGGYFTTDVSEHVISGKMCIENPAYPTTTDYRYYVINYNPSIKSANFLVIRNNEYKYFDNLYEASSYAEKSGDTLRFVGSQLDVTLMSKYYDQLWSNGGVTYDLNGHTLRTGLSYTLTLFDSNVIVKNGTIVVPKGQLCGSNTITTFNVHFADVLLDEVLEHVSGEYVKDQEGFFTMQASAPTEYLAKIVRGERNYYYTCALATSVNDGDYVYAKGYDSDATFVLSNQGDSITVERPNSEIEFPAVVYSIGDVDITILSETKRTYTAIPIIICEATKAGSQSTTKYCESLSEGFEYIKETGGTVKLLKDIYLAEDKTITIDFDSFGEGLDITLDFAGKRIVGTIVTKYAFEGLIYFENLQNGSKVLIEDSASSNGGVILNKNNSTANAWRALFYFTHDLTSKPYVEVTIASGFYSNYVDNETTTNIVYYGKGNTSGHTGTSKITVSGGTYVMYNGEQRNMVYGDTTEVSGVTFIDGANWEEDI